MLRRPRRMATTQVVASPANGSKTVAGTGGLPWRLAAAGASNPFSPSLGLYFCCFPVREPARDSFTGTLGDGVPIYVTPVEPKAPGPLLEVYKELRFIVGKLRAGP